MADPNKLAAIDALLSDLSRAIIGVTFNQFREVGTDDVTDAPTGVAAVPAQIPRSTPSPHDGSLGIGSLKGHLE